MVRHHGTTPAFATVRLPGSTPLPPEGGTLVSWRGVLGYCILMQTCLAQTAPEHPPRTQPQRYPSTPTYPQPEIPRYTPRPDTHLGPEPSGIAPPSPGHPTPNHHPNHTHLSPYTPPPTPTRPPNPQVSPPIPARPHRPPTPETRPPRPVPGASRSGQTGPAPPEPGPPHPNRPPTRRQPPTRPRPIPPLPATATRRSPASAAPAPGYPGNPAEGWEVTHAPPARTARRRHCPAKPQVRDRRTVSRTVWGCKRTVWPARAARGVPLPPSRAAPLERPMRHVSVGPYVDRDSLAVGEAARACGPAEAGRLFHRALPARPDTGAWDSSRRPLRRRGPAGPLPAATHTGRLSAASSRPHQSSPPQAASAKPQVRDRRTVSRTVWVLPARLVARSRTARWCTNPHQVPDIGSEGRTAWVLERRRRSETPPIL